MSALLRTSQRKAPLISPSAMPPSTDSRPASGAQHYLPGPASRRQVCRRAGWRGQRCLSDPDSHTPARLPGDCARGTQSVALSRPGFVDERPYGNRVTGLIRGTIQTTDSAPDVSWRLDRHVRRRPARLTGCIGAVRDQGGCGGRCSADTSTTRWHLGLRLRASPFRCDQAVDVAPGNGPDMI